MKYLKTMSGKKYKRRRKTHDGYRIKKKLPKKFKISEKIKIYDKNKIFYGYSLKLVKTSGSEKDFKLKTITIGSIIKTKDGLFCKILRKEPLLQGILIEQ